METYNYKVEVISPIHVGSGETLLPVDYIFHNNRLYVMDVEGIIESLTVKQCDLFSKTLIQQGDLLKTLQLLNMPLTNIEKNAKYSFPATIKPTQLHCFIKSAFNNPYLPGSSIKGALRTAICYSLFSLPNNKRWLFNEVRRRIRWRNAAKALQDFVESIFGSKKNRYSPHHDVLKFLRISDSEPAELSALEVEEINVITVKTANKNRKQVKTFIEALKPGTILYGNLSIDKTLSREAYSQFKKGFKNYEALTNVGAISSYAKNFCSAIIDHEMEFAAVQGINQLKVFYQNLKENVLQKLGENEFLLRLGWGSGYMSVTIGMLLMEDAGLFQQLRKKFRKLGKPYGKLFPTSRKVISRQGQMIPLGWAKFTID